MRKIMFRCWYKSCFREVPGICRCLYIHQAVSSSYNHQSNGQVEVSMKLTEHTMKKWCETNNDLYLSFVTDKFNTHWSRTT